MITTTAYRSEQMDIIYAQEEEMTYDDYLQQEDDLERAYESGELSESEHEDEANQLWAHYVMFGDN